MQIKPFTCTGKHKTSQELKACPVCSRRKAIFNMKQRNIYQDFEGSSPSIFVGSYNYPDVNVGLLTLPETKEDAWKYDAPSHWSKTTLNNAQIVGLRSSLINSSFSSNVYQKQKFLELVQDSAMAKKPVDFEINLKDKPKLNINFDNVVSPMGPRVQLKKATETSNPNIPLHVDKVASAEDMKTTEAIQYLQQHNYDENYITKILSVGTIGIEENRKLVPTRWSITATDDMLCKNILKEVRKFQHGNNLVYSGDYMGNYYFIFFLSGMWSYELFEMYLPTKEHPSLHYSTDFELFKNRTSYADKTVGGYYTVRLAIAEKLKDMKKQNTAFVLRVITPEYKVPLGVWVTREAARKALSNKPIEFSSKELMLNYLKHLINKKFGFDIDEIIKASKLLNEKQKTLGEY